MASVFLVIFEKPANPLFTTGKTGTILNVYTKKEYRRQGLAAKLLEMAIEEAKKRNLSYLDLTATADGISVYKKMGFVEDNVRNVPMKLSLLD